MKVLKIYFFNLFIPGPFVSYGVKTDKRQTNFFLHIHLHIPNTCLSMDETKSIEKSKRFDISIPGPFTALCTLLPEYSIPYLRWLQQILGMSHPD